MFYERSGVLPLPGTVPDMKAQTSDYTELQTVYKSKAREDAASLLNTIRLSEAKVGRTVAIDEKAVEAFSKAAAHIKLIRGRPLHVVAREGKNDHLDWSNAARRCGTLDAST
jgi:amyloid beta precursor protein binding protein 1